MAYPAGITLSTITVGSVIDFFGESTDISVTVRPVLGGDGKAKHIVHATTGHVLLVRTMVFQGSPGGPISFQVPHVDQGGFIDSSGQAITMWAYEATVVYGKGKEDRWVKNFQPLIGQDLLDLDLIPDGNITEPVTAPAAAVTSVNGTTGAVTLIEATPENVEAGLPLRLSEAELSSTYASRELMADAIAQALAQVETGGGISDVLYSSLPLVGRGDSTTAQTSNPDAATRAYTLLADALGVQIVNRGNSGARSDEIAHLAGGLDATATVVGGAIPESGYAVLTGLTPDLIRAGEISSYKASIAGVRGTLARVGTERRFTRDETGTAVTVTDATIKSLDNENYHGNILMVGMGTNDIPLIEAGTRTVAEVCENIARTIAALTPLVPRFLVWTPFDRGASEGASTARGGWIREIEEFTANYADKYVPLRSLLSTEGLTRAGITPTTQDNTDMAAGAIPQSLRDPGSVHLNAAGMAVHAEIFEEFFREKNWFAMTTPATVLTSDAFTGPDGSADTRTTDATLGGSPQAYQVQGAGIYTIASGTLQRAGGTTTTSTIAVSVTEPVVETSVKVVSHASGSTYIDLLDGLNGANGYRLRMDGGSGGNYSVQLYRRAGSQSVLGTMFSASPGDRIALRRDGAAISYLRNGAVVETVTDPTPVSQTLTHTGITFGTSGTATLDDLMVTAP